MTLPDENVIKIHGKPLMQGATARCSMCGKTRDLGRILSPGFNYGVVMCSHHASLWMDAVVRSFTDGMFSMEDVFRDISV